MVDIINLSAENMNNISEEQLKDTCFYLELTFGNPPGEQKSEIIENISRRFIKLPFKEDLNQELKENRRLCV